MSYLIFENKQQCIDASNQISSNLGCNIIGKNAKTGELQPEKQKTTQWATPIQDINGVWYLSKPKDEFMTDVSYLGIVDYIAIPLLMV